MLRAYIVVKSSDPIGPLALTQLYREAGPGVSQGRYHVTPPPRIPIQFSMMMIIVDNYLCACAAQFKSSHPEYLAPTQKNQPTTNDAIHTPSPPLSPTSPPPTSPRDASNAATPCPIPPSPHPPNPLLRIIRRSDQPL